MAGWLVASAGVTRAGILDWIFPKHEVEVIAVTDMTPLGALRRPVTPANPVYYQAVSAGYRDLGGIIAGDKIPPKEDVMKTIAKVLAKQGYLPATNEHPPTLIVIWVWGTMYTERIYSGNPDDTEGRQVFVAGAPRTFPARETAVLEILLRRGGNVAPKRLFEDHLFGLSGDVGSNAVEVYVHRLRKMLADSGATVKIHTVRGVGYLMAEDKKA